MRPELHPACAAFPPLPDDDLRELANDIKQNGLLEPITLTPDGLVLDGRTRWEACEIAGVEPRTTVYAGDDPVAFVLSKNKHRRHLSKSQLAMVVARLANLPRGGNGNNQHGANVLIKNISSAEALSKQSDVPRAYTNYARTVIKNGEPHIIGMVDQGEVNVRVAAEAIRKTPRAAQAGWTADDVERKGRAVIRAYPCNIDRKHSKADKTKPVKTKLPPQKMIDPPYTFNKWPTPEETGYPINGTVNEQDAHRARYGRTQMHPMDVTHMQEHEMETASLEVPIISLTSKTRPSAERFFELIDKMLGWKPQAGATNGRQIDYATKARRRLASLEERLPQALELLHALDEGLKARKAPGTGVLFRSDLFAASASTETAHRGG